jgi:hypothetical protein
VKFVQNPHSTLGLFFERLTSSVRICGFDVGNEAFDSKLHSIRVLAVPPWADKVVESMDRLISLDSNRASMHGHDNCVGYL